MLLLSNQPTFIKDHLDQLDDPIRLSKFLQSEAVQNVVTLVQTSETDSYSKSADEA